MSVILNKVHVRDVDPNNSDAVKEALSTFFQNISKHAEADCNRWLRALESIINRFPKYCMSHRNVIETYLVRFLDCNTYHNIVLAGKCAHSLQQVRPSQEKTATPKTSWRDQLTALCNTAHALVGAVFPSAIDIHQHAGNRQEQPLTNSPISAALFDIVSVSNVDNNQNKHALLSIRLRNVFVFIQAMLVETYPVAKPVRPQIVLDVILRALSVSSGMKAAGDYDLSDVIAVKTQSLRTLDALVACLGSNLIPFSPLVFRIVMQTLKWTSDNPSEESSNVRVTAYNSLRLWLTTLHTHRLSDGRWEDELTNHLVGDVTPRTHVIQLNVNAQPPTKNLSKKARRKLANSMLLQSSISSHMPGDKGKSSLNMEQNEDVTLAALECTETFLTVCGLFLKPSTHKMFQERLIRECYTIDSSSSDRTLGMLRAVDACRKSVPPGVPPPTQHCLQLYSAALNSTHQEISHFCSRALLDIRLHLHCSPPSINFAVEVHDETQKEREEKKQEVSERNRAALEALLGEDRMPNHQEDDVISIPDEPSRKKQRLEEEVDDQISLSSESHESEEYTDAEIIEPDAEMSEQDEEIIEKDTETAENSDQVDGTSETASEQADNATQQEKLTNGWSPSSIHELNTQMPQQVIGRSETDGDKSPISMEVEVEVTYDYPNTAKESVPVLETIGGDNLPSTNDTDDIQITCGQVVKSQEKPDEIETEVGLTQEVEISAEVKLTSIENKKSVDKTVDDGDPTEEDETGKIVINGEKVTVEDMLADFVDEVVEDKTQATQV